MAREWTDEERKAFAEKMRNARAKKTEAVVPEQPKEEAPVSRAEYEALLAKLEQLGVAAQPAPQTAAPAASSAVIELFSVNPSDYPNPVEAIYDNPKFTRFALRQNFELRWKVTPVRYQTAQGAWMMEPRFEITLLRRRFNEEGAELPSKIVVGRASFFEDPPANMLEAELAGLDDADFGSKDFANQMRMYRCVRWLDEKLNPRRPGGRKLESNLEVIGGKVYEIEAYNELAE